MGREKSSQRTSTRRHNPIARPQTESSEAPSRAGTPTPASNMPPNQEITAPATQSLPHPHTPKVTPLGDSSDQEDAAMDQLLTNAEETPIASTATLPPSQTSDTPFTSEIPPSDLTDEQLLDSFLEVADMNRSLAASTPNIMAAGLGKFTPMPEGGFPHIHLLSPGSLTDDMNRTTLRNWLQLPGPKVAARVFDYDGSDPSGVNPIATRRIKDVVDDVSKALHASTRDCKVSPPAAAEGVLLHSCPKTFLIYNIAEETRTTLLAQRIWSSSTITLEIRELAPRTLPVIFISLAGITTNNPATVRATVQDTWRDPVHRSMINNVLRDHDPNLKAKPLPDVAHTVDRFISTARIEFLDFKAAGGIATPRFHVFAESPTSSVHAWSALRKLISTFVYTTPLDGVGEVTRYFDCPICHSITHPRGLCQFPNVPMWNGPTHDGKQGKKGGNNRRA